ncbi:MAG: Rne/Rng family ribonuclease [Nitrospinae bacterium]|nr:Rne/Rng family ribonuclease [Nitrospinota bacterium]
MSLEIIVNANGCEDRLAILEKGVVRELFIDRKRERGIVGNIYKGKVIRVLPGMQVAFVDIGLEKAGFLHVGDIDTANKVMSSDSEKMKRIAERVGEDAPDEIEIRGSQSNLRIEDIIKKGDELLVQVTKDPLGTKGARITSYITLPGRYMVFMPTVSQVGVSRKIEDEKERRRLKDIMTELQPPGAGFIVRTVSAGHPWEDFIADINYLKRMWEDIRKKAEIAKAPALVLPDLDLSLRAIRDLFTREVDLMVIDSAEEYEKCASFADKYIPEIRDRIEMYNKPEPIFDAYGIEKEIEKALNKKVWLKCGGYLVIEQTEALTSIDVNTGKFVGKKNQEDTIVKTNLEAGREIVHQLQLRNLGGLIIIDFIDMDKKGNRAKVFNDLEDAFKDDRAKTNIMKISEFGLVEMTRERTRDSLSRILCQPCAHCEGRSVVKSVPTVAYEIFREIRRVSRTSGKDRLNVGASPDVANFIMSEEKDHLKELEQELKVSVSLRSDRNFHQEKYSIKPA